MAEQKAEDTNELVKSREPLKLFAMTEWQSNTVIQKLHKQITISFSGLTSNATPFINCLQDKKYYLTCLLKQGEHKSIKEFTQFQQC